MARSAIRTWTLRLVRVVVTAGVILWITSTVLWRDHAVLDGGGQTLPIVARGENTVTVETVGPQTCFDLIVGGARSLFVERPAATTRTIPWSQVQQLNGRPLVKVGLRGVVGQIRWSTLAWAIAIFGGVPLFAGLRWRRLLYVQNVHLSIPTALKLTWVGLFFNQFLIGTVGGDLVKAYYVTHHTATAKTESVLTILIDRIIGMLGLLWLAGAGILIWLALRPGGQGLPPGLPWAWVIGLIAFMALAATVTINGTIRRAIGLESLLRRLPESHRIRRLDRAAVLYWRHKRIVAEAFGWTFLSHVCLLLATWLAALSLGMYGHMPPAVALLHTVTVATIIYVAAGVLPSLAGLGPLEAGFVLFFAAAAIGSDAQALALALTYRVNILLWSMPGAALLMVGSHLPSRKQMRQEMNQLECQP